MNGRSILPCPCLFTFLLCYVLLPGCADENISKEALSVTAEQHVESDTLQEQSADLFDYYTPSASPNADSILNAANTYLQTSKYDSAIVLAREAERLYREIDFKEGQVRSVNNWADALRRMGKYEEVFPLLEKNLENGVQWLGESHVVIGDIYNSLGGYYSDQEDYRSAFMSYERSLEIRKNTLGDQHPIVGRSINNIGVLYANLGYYDKALAYYHEALSIRKAALGEVHGDVAQDYNNIAVALKNNGDYEQSLIFHDRALAIRKELFGEINPEVGASYYNIGVTYGQNRMYEKALENHKTSLRIWKEVFPKGHRLIGLNYNAVGIDYNGIENYDKALEYSTLALNHNLSVLGENHSLVASNFQTLGSIHAKKKDFVKALGYFNKSRQIFKATLGENQPLMAGLYRSMAHLYNGQNDHERALEFVDLSIQANHIPFEVFDPQKKVHIEEYSSESILLQTLVFRARVLIDIAAESDINVLIEAFRCYQIAFDVIDQYRKSFKGNVSRLLLVEQSSLMHNEALDLALRIYRITGEESYLDEAFKIAEKGKALVLLDAINEADARQYSGIPDSLLQKENELRVLLNYYERRIKNAQIRGENQEKDSQVKKEFFDLNKEYLDLLETFEESYPEYHNLKHTYYTASMEDVQTQMLSEDELLIEYAVGEDSLFIFVLTENVKHVEAVPIDSTFAQQVDQYKNGITQRDRSLFFPAAYELYKTLIAPVQEVALSKENWVVVPDGIINGIPFEALITQPLPVNSDYHKAPYLIRDHTIRYTYSATLELTQAAYNELKSDKGQETRKDFIAFAPVFSSGFSNWVRGQEMVETIKPDSVEGRTWGHIPESKTEIKAINAKFNERYSLWNRLINKPSSIYLDNQANEEQLKSLDLSQYRYVHFATHGVLNEAEPELSGIIMAQDTTSSEDGILHLGEIYNLQLDADLVVLSACQTGVGKLSRGEGLMSLTRGFMYAGADALLATYWQIADGTARELMVSFYDHLLNEKDAATSIREAKLALMENEPALAVPYYWAGFVLIGQ